MRTDKTVLSRIAPGEMYTGVVGGYLISGPQTLHVCKDMEWLNASQTQKLQCEITNSPGRLEAIHKKRAAGLQTANAATSHWPLPWFSSQSYVSSAAHDRGKNPNSNPFGLWPQNPHPKTPRFCTWTRVQFSCKKFYKIF